MPIQPSQPIVVPEKSFDKLWAKQIIIIASEPNGEAFAEIQLLPYNDNGDVAHELTQTLNVTEIMAKASADPTSNIAKAMYFLLAAIDDLYKEQNP